MDISTLKDLNPSQPEYWKALRRTEPETTSTAESPGPEWTSRDPWPDGLVAPKQVTDLIKYGERHGWTTTVTYSRGCAPNGRSISDWFLVRMLHPETKARFFGMLRVGPAMHKRDKADGGGTVDCEHEPRCISTTWSTLVLSSEVPMTASMNITAAKKNFIATSGRKVAA